MLSNFQISFKISDLNHRFSNEKLQNNNSSVINKLYYYFQPESGSDVGAFVGGLLGATIKGLARPPGPVSLSTYIQKK